MEKETVIKVFYKLIKNIIIPQYPWIRDVEIEIFKGPVRSAVLVVYYIDEEVWLDKTKDFLDVDDDTKRLFNMLNFGPEFYYYDSRVRVFDI